MDGGKETSIKEQPNRHVGILVETEDTWGRNVVESVCRFAQARQWTVLIAPRDQTGKLRLPAIWNGNGVIATLRHRSTATHLKKLGLPVVDVSGTMRKQDWFARVTTDDRERAEMALDHLRSRGLRHFACYAPVMGRYSDARSDEFRMLAESAGFTCAMYTSDDRDAAGWLTNYKRARLWLAKLPRPLGVFAADPYPARQLVEICAMNSIRVPDDVAILAADDDELLCHVAWPQISSIELASHRIGEDAATQLERQMDGAAAPGETKKIPPLRIRPRQSTDMLAIDNDDLARALMFIREHAKDGITVSDVVRTCLLSRRSLEQRFREELNRSPGEEIRSVRLQHVRRLLVDTDKSIATIAAESGFASGASLSQAFQKQFGETPGHFRQSR